MPWTYEPPSKEYHTYHVLIERSELHLSIFAKIKPVLTQGGGADRIVFGGFEPSHYIVGIGCDTRLLGKGHD